MNLIIDIGNTYVKIAIYQNGRMVSSYRRLMSDLAFFDSIISNNRPGRAIISSVAAVPSSITGLLTSAGIPHLILSAETPFPIKVDYETPETLGMDRLAAVAGAHNFSGGKDVLVIDAGSAITFDTIVNGRYPGGSISPGLSMRFKALNEFTARLPLVMPSEAVDFPARGTRSAIATGVVEGLIFEINEYIRRFRKEGGNKMVFLTGGDSDFLLERIDNEVTHFPELVLEGLNFILEYNA